MIDFVILHYQALEETISCVNSIFEKVNGDKKIIIIDNLSPNGSGNILAEKYKYNSDIRVILMSANLGFAKANNLGFAEAKKDAPDFIVVMNNDVIIKQDDFCERISQSYKEHHFAIMGPDIFSTRINGHQNPQRMTNYTLEELETARKKLEFKNNHKWLLRLKYMLPCTGSEKKRNHIAPALDNEVLENVVLHGACYVFSKDFWLKHDHCFYNETFMYYESYILHFLAQKEGLKMIYDPNVKVFHHEDVATNQTFGEQYKKAVFVNKCQLESCKKYIDLIVR